MSVLELDSPQMIMHRLTEIENDLAVRQNAYESAARGYFNAKREQEKQRARAFLTSEEVSVTARKAAGDLSAADLDGSQYEAEYEALRAVIRVLEGRSMICMALLKAQGRA